MMTERMVTITLSEHVSLQQHIETLERRLRQAEEGNRALREALRREREGQEPSAPEAVDGEEPA